MANEGQCQALLAHDSQCRPRHQPARHVTTYLDHNHHHPRAATAASGAAEAGAVGAGAAGAGSAGLETLLRLEPWYVFLYILLFFTNDILYIIRYTT